MTITRDTSATAGYNSTSPGTLSYTCGTGTNPYLVAFFDATNTDQCSGVTYNSVAMTLLARFTLQSRTQEIWGLPAPTTGSAQNISFTRNGGGSFSFVSFSAASYFGVKQSTTPDATNSATGTASTPAVSASNTVADALGLISCIGTTSPGTPNAGQTAIRTTQLLGKKGPFDGSSDKIFTSIASQTLGYQSTATTWGANMVILQGAPVTANHNNLLLLGVG